MKRSIKSYQEAITVITHRNADPDALASVLAFKEIVERLVNRNIGIILPEGPNLLSKTILLRLDIQLEKYVVNNIDPFSTLFIVVDTSNSGQLDKYSDMVLSSNKIILVDHHSKGDLDDKALVVLKSFDVASTSEIVYMIARSLGIELRAVILQLLLAGLIYDSRHLILAKPTTFRVVSEIIEKGISYQETIRLLQVSPSLPERIARIKASLRARYYRIDDIIIALTRIGAYEAGAARNLIELGADMVFVIGDHDDEIRVIARASPSIVEDLGIHVSNNILMKLGEIYRGSGGGHPSAGGFTIRERVDIDELEEKLLELALRILKEKGITGELVEIKA